MSEIQDFASAAMMYVAEGERIRGGWPEAESLVARALELSARRNEADVSSGAALLMRQVAARVREAPRPPPREPAVVRAAANEIVRRLEKQRARH